MRDCSYSDRLSLLRLYSLQRRRERYCIIYVWKRIEDLVPNLSKPILSVEEDILLSLMQTLVDLAHLPIIVSGGVPFDYLIPCQNLLDPLLVLSMVSSIHLILI